jgi:5-oxoprolinase (ATP-hydrolysing) subunit A
VRVALEPFGDAAWRARLPQGADGRAVLEALRSLPHVVDAVVSEHHALVTFQPGADPHGVIGAIDRALSVTPPAIAAREHVVLVRYGGEDLEEVARTTMMSPDEFVALHADRAYVVALIGFLPGFAYLRGLDPRIVVQRRASPRARIAPLSIGVAGPYTGVYPFASPGGWNLVGVAVGFMPFDVRAGAKLALGDRVTFVRERS